MTTRTRRSQHAPPFWVPSLDVKSVQGKRLERLVFAPKRNEQGIRDSYDEGWLQKLLYRFPLSLPISELEPGLGSIIAVAREVPTPAGQIDNVFVTDDGNIVLVECKLWRNPEARRKVIGQIIDYAQSIAHWRYDDFDHAVRLGIDADGQLIGKPLVELVAGAGGDVDEVAFVDVVQRNLRLGRMLLLVVGDGVREDAERLADYLQMHAGFHFTLGLIEVAIYEMPDKSGFLVQPRVLARTLNIERAIVRLASDALAAEPTISVKSEATRVDRPMLMTEEIFFEKLAATSPEAASGLKDLLNRAEQAGMNLYLGPATRSAALKWDADDGRTFNLGGVNLAGTLNTYAIGWVPNAVGKLDVAHDYLEKMSRLVGGSVRKTPDPAQWSVVKSGTTLPQATELFSKTDDWLALIREYQAALQGKAAVSD